MKNNETDRRVRAADTLPHLDTPGEAFSEPRPIPFYDSPGAYIRGG